MDFKCVHILIVWNSRYLFLQIPLCKTGREKKTNINEQLQCARTLLGNLISYFHNPTVIIMLSLHIQKAVSLHHTLVYQIYAHCEKNQPYLKSIKLIKKIAAP